MSMTERERLAWSHADRYRKELEKAAAETARLNRENDDLRARIRRMELARDIAEWARDIAVFRQVMGLPAFSEEATADAVRLG